MEADAKVIKYRDETTLRVRMFVAVVVIPFIVILAIAFISAFGLFGRASLDLIWPILQGDFARFGDFLGYMVLLLLGVGLPCALLYVSIRKGILAPNILVTLDPRRRIVSIQSDLPWQSARHTEYGFSEVEAIELANSSLSVSEQNEISLRIRGLKRRLVLAAMPDARAAAKEFRKLKEMGLPSR